MMSHEPHQMVLSDMRTNGEEEWYCPVCGRRLLIAVSPLTTNPGIAIYVISEGETEVAHTFAHEKPGEDLSRPVRNQSIETVSPLTEEEQSRLKPFIEWMESIQLD